jgi:hypothetical protein
MSIIHPQCCTTLLLISVACFVLWDTIPASNRAVRRWVTVGVLRNEQSHYVKYHEVMMDLDNLANLVDAWIHGCFLVFM